MPSTTKVHQKRPASSHAGPKPKKIHLENDNSKVKKRSQPVTAPLKYENDEEGEDEEGDEDEFLGLEEGDQPDEKMVVDDHPPAAPKDPNGAFS